MTKEEINCLILNNKKLAYSIAHKYRQKVSSFIDFEDLKSTCLLGLVKAANSFDEEKEVQFSTYAYKIIQNEILSLIKRETKHLKVYSLDDIIADDISFIELISDNQNLEEQFILLSEINKLKSYINSLPDILKSIVNYTLKGLSQQEIGKNLNISQSQVSRLYYQALNLLRIEFDKEKDKNG
jgi:RNA polymerase sporulation-specific sigma factor